MNNNFVWLFLVVCKRPAALKEDPETKSSHENDELSADETFELDDMELVYWLVQADDCAGIPRSVFCVHRM